LEKYGSNIFRNRIIAGEVPDPKLYERVLQWPDLWDDAAVYETYRDEMYDKEVHREKLAEHQLMNTVRWAAKSPRYAFEHIESGASGQTNENGAAEGENEAEVHVPEDLTELPDGADAILDEGGDDDDSGLEDEDDSMDEDAEGEEDIDMIMEQGERGGSESDESTGKGRAKTPRPFGGLYR
jgi:hypothetical protein